MPSVHPDGLRRPGNRIGARRVVPRLFEHARRLGRVGYRISLAVWSRRRGRRSNDGANRTSGSRRWRICGALPELGYDRETRQWSRAILEYGDPTPPFDRSDVTESAADAARLRGIFPYLSALAPHVPAGVIESRLERLLSMLHTGEIGTADVWDTTNVALRILGWLEGTEHLRTAGVDLRRSTLFSPRYLQAHDRALRAGRWIEPSGNHRALNALGRAAFELLSTGRALDAPALARLERDLGAQFLSDGGHVERCPFYHLQLLSAMDTVARIQENRAGGGRPVLGGIRAAAREALRLMVVGDHPARFGDISRLWTGRTAAAETLRALGGRPCRANRAYLSEFGLAMERWRVADGLVAELAVDLGPFGLYENPGHGHDDALSFVLHVGGLKVVTDPGVYRYSSSPDSQWFKLSRAHNVVWYPDDPSPKGFYRWPMAITRKTVRKVSRESGRIAAVRARKSGSVHWRAWTTRTSGLVVHDRVRSYGRGGGISRINFGPGCRVRRAGNGSHWILDLDGGRLGRLSAHASQGHEVRLVQSRFAPEYGRCVPAQALEWVFPEGTRNWALGVTFDFAAT
jgi:hypothetical protein